MKKIICITLIVISIMGMLNLSVMANENYENIYIDFLKNNQDKINSDFLQLDNTFIDETAKVNDVYMFDADNDRIPELFIIFGTYYPYASVCYKYSNGEIVNCSYEVYFVGGNGSNSTKMQKRILMNESGDAYFEKYYSAGLNQGEYLSHTDAYNIYKIENGNEVLVDTLSIAYEDFWNSDIKYFAYSKSGEPLFSLDGGISVSQDEAQKIKNDCFEGYKYLHELCEDDYATAGMARYWNIQSTLQEKSTIKVLLNNNLIQFDQPPILQSGRTLVPLRAIFEAMGATVGWDNDTQTVTSTLGSITITMQIGNNVMYKSKEFYDELGVKLEGLQEIPLDVSAHLIGGRTLVPVRAIAESFGATVDWGADTQTVFINY